MSVPVVHVTDQVVYAALQAAHDADTNFSGSAADAAVVRMKAAIEAALLNVGLAVGTV